MVLEQIHTSDSWEGGVPSPKLPSTSQLESYVHDLNIYYAIMQIYIHIQGDSFDSTSHASPFGIPSRKKMSDWISHLFLTQKWLSMRERYVRSLGSGGFLKKCLICHILEGNFGHFSPFQITPYFYQKWLNLSSKMWDIFSKSPHSAPQTSDISFPNTWPLLSQKNLKN